MWEITLISSIDDYNNFLYLESTLKNYYHNVIVAITCNSSSVICSVATNNEFQKNLIKELICETILQCYKYRFFKNNLSILGCDNNLNDFIMLSIVSINFQDEIDYVVKKFSNINKIHIDSFFQFRVHNLINIWYEIVSYLNLTLKNSSDDDLYLHFLKFLAKNRDSEGVTYIKSKGNKIYLTDGEDNIIYSSALTDEINLIVNLIMHSPKKIIINCIDQLSDKITNLMYYIFEDKISLLM